MAELTEKLNIEVSAYGQKRTVRRILEELSHGEIEGLFEQALKTFQAHPLRSKPKEIVATERSWWDLTKDEGLAFARKVVKEDVTGWDELKAAARDFGFEPDEDMPTVFELQRMGGKQGGKQDMTKQH